MGKPIYYKPKIVRDLKQSGHLVNSRGLTFVFSSANNAERFRSRMEEHNEIIRESLSKRFKMEIGGLWELSCILLYRQIENRGFRVLYGGKLVTKEDEILCRLYLKLSHGEK